MLKGIAGMLLGTLVTVAIILGVLYFFNVFAIIAAALALSILVIAVIIGVAVFLFVIFAFFMLFYYLAEKTPEVTPGNYTLDQQKGKHE